MNKIKFSEDYEKLPLNWEGTQALLLAIVPMKVETIKNRYTAMWKWDTKIRGKDEYYSLDFEDALVLLFMHLNTGRLFSTIRRNYEEKEKYYRSQLNNTFILERIK